MAGEMTASEVTREEFPLHFAIADAFKGQVKPFDWYQGPYVVIGSDVVLGSEPYGFCPRGLGIVRLWICSDDGVIAYVYNEATDKKGREFLAYDPSAELEVVESALETMSSGEVQP